MGYADGDLLGRRVSPTFVGDELCGRLDGRPVGFLLGALDVGHTVGWQVGILLGMQAGLKEGRTRGWPEGLMYG